MKICKHDAGHMTKMAAMPIYGKNPSKISSRTGGAICSIRDSCPSVYINDDPVVTLTFFTARSNLET